MRHWKLGALAALGTVIMAACAGGEETSGLGAADTGTDGSLADGFDPDGGFHGETGDTGGCVPKVCKDLGVDCGKQADGCGGLIECGNCVPPAICGGGGKPSLCGTAPCTAKTCIELGASCGKQGDGCGGLIDCGTCTAPETCGGGGVPNACGKTTVDGGACTPKTCTAMGFDCGPVADGCGGLVDCGKCTAAGTSCGGGGKPSVCGGVTCVKKTCKDYGADCGPVADGCGGIVTSCGTCTAPTICGGGGSPSVCGGGTTSTSSCVGLECKQVKCEAGTSSISGVVYDPAGRVPLYNVYVFVPNGPVGGFVAGASCDKCADALSGYPLVTAVTDEKGAFKLDNVPVGTGIPLIIQTGKWRRQVKITTAACVDTPITKDLTRLPRDKSEGDIPKIAISTGGFDSLECLLRKIGIADSEFTNPSGTGRVNLYQGMPPVTTSLPGGGKIPASTGSYTTGVTFPKSETMWNDLPTLKTYDVVLLACEGAEYGDPSVETVLTSFPKKVSYFGTKSATALKNMQDYTAIGGRVFASHYHYYWLKAGPSPWPSLVSWGYNPDLTPLTGLAESIVTTFPKGNSMAKWLVNVGGSPTLGTIVIREPQHSVNSFDSTKLTEWIYAAGAKDTTGATISHAAQYLSFNTPVDKPTTSQCGRFVFSDIHVTAGDITDKPFPSGCSGGTTLSPQELALEFMLFDLSSRVCDDKLPPTPPSCTKRSCTELGVECGPAADGCGGLLACGPCIAPSTCGGGGVPGKCGGGSCIKKTCTELGVKCGPSGDGCGGTMDCGPCPGVDGGGCVPLGCGGRCGPQGDGCGGVLSCPACDGGTCVKTTCTLAGADCGFYPDGCGGLLDCGSCTPPSTCGGSGTPNKCGGIK